MATGEAGAAGGGGGVKQACPRLHRGGGALLAFEGVDEVTHALYDRLLVLARRQRRAGRAPSYAAREAAAAQVEGERGRVLAEAEVSYLGGVEWPST